MSVKRKFGTAAAITVAAALLGSGHADAAACSPTGFFRDGINMTAAVIASGDIANGTVNASGCNIGIYYGPGTAGTVSNTQVSGANYFGVVVSGDADGFSAAGAATVDVTDNNVHDIGESPLNGSQHGVAIYYRACDAGASATGIISGNAISKYQKGGIVVSCAGATASVMGNTVAGQGPVNYIAQNGIQISYGASGQVMRNAVTGNAYSGTNNASSAGILVFGGCSDFDGAQGVLTTGVQIVGNTVDGNDMGVALANYDHTCSVAPTSATNEKVINNTITDAGKTNVSGNGYPHGYQAGIYDSGVNDKLINNKISGAGYEGPCLSSGATEYCSIDVSGATSAKVHANRP